VYALVGPSHPDVSPFSPSHTEDASRPWAINSLETALKQLASPPVSRQGSREGSVDNSGFSSPIVRSGRNSPRPDSSSSNLTAVQLPAHSPGGTKVDTSDSSYAAFVKQWCFAQSTPPSGPGSSPSAVSSAGISPVPTPPPTSSMSGVGMGFMSHGGSFGGQSMAGFGHGHGVAARRQQAWPAEHQVGVGSNMGLGAGYGFPGAFSYGQRGSGHPHDGPGVGVVGGELVF
jgi:hypothetical protein